MASAELIDAVDNYDGVIGKARELGKNIKHEWIEAYTQACAIAFYGEKDIPYGLECAAKAKSAILEYIQQETNGDFKRLEEYQQEKKEDYDVIKWIYQLELMESPYLLDSFMLYMEKNRPRKERFYEPRRKTLKQIVDGLQRLEDGENDELFIHMPARVGKTQAITMATLWHCARDTEKSNLYVTYKEGLGGAFLDGFQELITDPTYCFADVFPRVKITDTDAKNNKIDLGIDGRRRKKYKSISGKGLESGLNGEYDAYGWMVMDDLYEGIQDVLSEETRKRKQLIFDNNAITRAKEQCKKIWNGTIWSLHDIFMNRQTFLAENPDAKKIRYEIIKIPALDPDTDESNFDYDYGVGFTTEYYRMLRSKFEANDDMAGWYAQDQQEPIERNGAVFDANHMHYYNGVLPDEEPIKVVGYCDVALGGGDYVSFPVAYVYADGRTFIHDVVFDNSEKHITQPQVVAKIKAHEVRNVRFEANQGGIGYKDDIEKMLKDQLGAQAYNYRLTTAWAKTMRGSTGYHKAQRIWDNAESIRQLYFLDTAHRDVQYRKFMQNLFSFSMNMKKKAHDDAADSLSGLVDFLNQGSGIRVARVISSPI